MSYEVRLRRAAQKELDSLSQKDYRAVSRVIDSLDNHPRPQRVKKLAASGLWRVRLGKYRVVYAIDDTNKLVIIVRAARRMANG